MSDAVSSWGDAGVDPTPPYVLFDAFEDYVGANIDSTLDEVRQWLKTGLKHYPELADQTIYVGITHEDVSYHGEPHAMADPYNRIVYLNEGSMTEGYQTLFHELMHILIRREQEQGKDVPITSEEYCSIRTIAKMPSDLLYRDDISYLGKPGVPKDEWPTICQRAINYRENNRNYIQKCKEWLKI